MGVLALASIELPIVSSWETLHAEFVFLQLIHYSVDH